MSEKAKAIGFRVHVKPDVNETEDYAKRIGIQIVGEDSRSRQLAVDTGIVVDIGPTAWHDYGGDPWVAIGDRVVYARHAGYSVGEDEDKVLVLNDADIVTKLETVDV